MRYFVDKGYSMPRCPACKQPCDLIEYEGIKVHNCGECGGYWLSEVKLNQICVRRDVQMSEAVRQRLMDMADKNHRREQLLCLSCGKLLEKHQFRIWDDIILDRCPKCQRIWLDQGELEKCQIYAEYFEDHPDQREAWLEQWTQPFDKVHKIKQQADQEAEEESTLKWNLIICILFIGISMFLYLK